MSKHAKIVLWLGLLLIVLSIVANWQALKAVIGSGTGTPFTGTTPANPFGPGPVVQPPVKGHKCPPGRRWSDFAKGCIPVGFPGK